MKKSFIRAMALVIITVIIFPNAAFAITTWTGGVGNLAEDYSNSVNEQNAGSATVGEQNALRVGRDYLNAMGFSYEGLIDQLEYEGFSHEEAVYACDILFERSSLPVKNGSSGSKVKEVQEKLIESGFLSGSADGIFGNGTEKAVKAFQTERGLDSTGIVDVETYNALFMVEESAKETSNEKANETATKEPLSIESLLEGCSEAELRELILKARLELAKYNAPAETGNVLYEDEFVKVEYSEIELNQHGKLEIKCTVENKSTRNLNIKMKTATCNGWDFTYYGNEGVVSVSASSKNRDTFTFSKFTELTEIDNIEAIEEIRYSIRVIDTDSYDTLVESDEYFYLDMPVS